MKIIIWTYDWVPGGEDGPRGFVRDLRLRWACEEAGLDYEVCVVPFDAREHPEHLARQPFAQVPCLEDGDLVIAESGCGLLHLSKKSEKLMPSEPAGEAAVTQWLFAALNSIELVSVPWWFVGRSGTAPNPLEGWLNRRLIQLETVLADREFLAADRFTVADLLMADVLRVSDVRKFGDRPATDAYLERILGRPAFCRAFADQLAHFEAADRNRESAGA